ncbi:MAG: hypothetical protein IJZ02_02665 [Clostridia bacterium]|nr:hypothetical protein [Clostridia bacterium]
MHFYEDADAEQGGYAENGEIYLNTRAPQQMMAQFFTHELTHTAENAEAYNLLAADIRGRLGDSLAEMKQRKIERYAQKGTALTDAGAEAEVIADYVAKNLFTNEAEITQLAKRNRNAALRVYDRIREWSAKVNGDTEKEFLLRAQRLYEKALRETRGTAGESERQNIIETLPDGRKYVKADRQVIMGNDPESWGKQVELYIYNKIRRGEDVPIQTDDGDIIWLTSNSEGKGSFRNFDEKNSSGQRRISDKMYEAKLNAETHIDELIQISERGDKNVPNRKPKHKKMARNGWNYRTAHFEDFDGRYYKLTISVADGDYGKIAYNIGKVERESKPNHQKWSIDENIDHPSGSKADDLAAFSNASIPQTDPNSNPSGENVTQLQQSKRQNAFTDESDELFERPVNNTPILSAEELAKRNEEYIRQDIREQFQARSDELAAEWGNKTGMEDLPAFLASEREITEAEIIAKEESARGKIAFSEGAAESDANAFTRDMLNGIAKDGFDRAQKKAASDMGFAMGKITWADSKAFDEAAGEGVCAGFSIDSGQGDMV